MSIKISAIAIPLVAVAFPPLAGVGCKPASAPRAERDKTQKGQQIQRKKRKPVPREELLMQLVFTLQRKGRRAKEPVPNASCQLHLLRDNAGALQVAADIGDLRRRTVYPRRKRFQRLPVYFPFGLDKAPLQIELHTSLEGAAMTRMPLHPRQGKLIELPSQRPNRWTFTCVLRQAEGPGVAIDGIFYGEKPVVLGNRAVSAKSARPAAIQRFMNERLRP